MLYTQYIYKHIIYITYTHSIRRTTPREIEIEREWSREIEGEKERDRDRSREPKELCDKLPQ